MSGHQLQEVHLELPALRGHRCLGQGRQGHLGVRPLLHLRPLRLGLLGGRGQVPVRSWAQAQCPRQPWCRGVLWGLHCLGLQVVPLALQAGLGALLLPRGVLLGARVDHPQDTC